MSFKFFYGLDEATSGTTPTTTANQGTASLPLTLDYGPGGMAFSADGEGSGLNWTAASETSDARAWAAIGSTIATELNGTNQGTFFLKWAGYSVDDWSTMFILGPDGGTPALMYERSVFGLHGFNFAGNSFNFYNSQSLIAVRIDTTQATIQERIKFYTLSGGVLTPITPDGGYGGYTLPQNATISGLTGTAQLVIGNRQTAFDNGEGMIKCAAWETAALDEATIEDVLLAIAADDDTMPSTTPTLSWLATPSADQITASSFRMALTTSLAATIKIIGYDNISQAQPSDATFDAAPTDGTSVAATVFYDTTIDLPANTQRRYWVRAQEVGGLGAKIYASVNVTTLAVSNSILSINGGNPIRYDQTSFQITWDEAPGSLSAVTINGVAQGAHTAVNSTTTAVARTSSNWPATLYGATVTLTSGSASGSTSMTPATGYSHVTLSGYNPASTTGEVETSPAAANGDQLVYNNETNTISIAANGIPTFTGAFDGTMSVAVVDQTDGAHSAFATINYDPPADIIPTQFDLGADVTGANPNTDTIRSFVVAGTTAATNVTFAATGSATVSDASNGTYGSSVVRQLGQTVYMKLTSGTYGAVVTGGVASGGVTDSVSVTTRAASVPTITVQPSAQNVTAGQVASFVLSATGASAYQWFEENGTTDILVSGATSSTYARTTVLGDNGKSFYCRVTSSEGGIVYSNTVGLTVNPANVTITSQVMRDASTKQIRASVSNIPVRIRRADGTIALSTTVNTNGSGIWTLTNNVMGVTGETVYVEFPDSGSGSYSGFSYTL